MSRWALTQLRWAITDVFAAGSLSAARSNNGCSPRASRSRVSGGPPAMPPWIAPDNSAAVRFWAEPVATIVTSLVGSSPFWRSTTRVATSADPPMVATPMVLPTRSLTELISGTTSKIYGYTGASIATTTRSAPLAVAFRASEPPACANWTCPDNSAATVLAPPASNCASTFSPCASKYPSSTATHSEISSPAMLLYPTAIESPSLAAASAAHAPRTTNRVRTSLGTTLMATSLLGVRQGPGYALIFP